MGILGSIIEAEEKSKEASSSPTNALRAQGTMADMISYHIRLVGGPYVYVCICMYMYMYVYVCIRVYV